MFLFHKVFVLFMLGSMSLNFTEPQLIEQKQDRIYNGRATTIEEFPFLVSIKYIKYEHWHWCGGSIINFNTILTAAHCTLKGGFKRMVAGATNIEGEGYLHTVRWIKVHEDYDTNNDIAIVRVNEAFSSEIGVMPIRLYDAEWIPVGTRAIVVGWGMRDSNDYSGNFPLQIANVQVISQEQCQLYSSEQVVDTEICTLDEETGKEGCGGDSGGPLIICGQLAGITIANMKCGEGPSYFTRIAPYLDWINIIFFTYPTTSDDFH